MGVPVLQKKSCLLFACLLVLSLALVGCGGEEKLAGSKWKLVKYEAQGVTMEGDALASMGDLGMEFVDDTTVKMSLMGMSIDMFIRDSVVLDTPGIQKPKNKLGRYMEGAVRHSLTDIEAALVVVDGAKGLGSRDEEALFRARHCGVPVVVALNKIAVSYTHLDVYKRQSVCCCTWRLIASKLSALMTCSIRHASSAAVDFSTPSAASQSDKKVCRS